MCEPCPASHKAEVQRPVAALGGAARGPLRHKLLRNIVALLLECTQLISCRLLGSQADFRKALTAAGIKQVIFPARNLPEVEAEVPESVRQGLTIVPVRRLDEVLCHAFDPPLVLQAAARL